MLKDDNMKKLIIGIIIGLSLGMATNTFASIGDRVEAVFAEFSYIVDGELKTLESPVLVHEGNSYLRTTQVANLLGYDVTYKADSRTIEFNGPEPAPILEPVDSQPLESPTESAEVITDGEVVEPTPSASPEPTPTPDNTAACDAIRKDYEVKIVMTGYQGYSMGKMKMEVLLLEYERDQKLIAAGC